MSGINLNPGIQTNFPGTFSVQSDGYIAGLFMDDPAVRFALAGGVLGPSETLPMWGGVAIEEEIPNPANTAVELGGIIIRATTNALITGFSVFNQNASAIVTPQSGVPLVTNGMGVNFFRLGSGARIAVKCDPTLAAALLGDPITQAVSWDFANQQLIENQPAYDAASVQSATYTSSTGIIQLTFASAPAGASPTNGAFFSVSGLAGAGVAPLNGDWQLVSSGSAGAVLSLQGPVGLGTLTITSSTGTLAAGGGTLACKVLNIQAGNSKTVSYNPATGFANWNTADTCALIQI